MAESLTSIVILSYNQVEFTKNCLESIREYTNVPYEIIVIDNNSTKETVSFLEKQSDIILVKNKVNAGFAGGCNQGMKLAKGEYILLLNNDTIVTKGYLTNMLTVLNTENNVAIVGPYTNNTIGLQKINIDFNYDDKETIEEYGKNFSQKKYQPVLTPRLIGYCMLFKLSVIQEIGMFDEAFKIGNYEDDDLCIRTLLSGYKLYICNNSFVYHYKRATFDKNKMDFEGISANNKIVLENKWDDINWNYYSVNNSYLLTRLSNIKPKTILHMGCGVGALAAAVKQEFECKYIGTECHEIREKIASHFVDSIISVKAHKDLELIPEGKYDVVIIEDMAELIGLDIMEFVKKFLGKNTYVFLRVFNKYHISSYISLIDKKEWRRTICASSKRFRYLYGDVTDVLIKEYKYQVCNSSEVKKMLNKKETKLCSLLAEYDGFSRESAIYSRIYELSYDRN